MCVHVCACVGGAGGGGPPAGAAHEVCTVIQWWWVELKWWAAAARKQGGGRGGRHCIAGTQARARRAPSTRHARQAHRCCCARASALSNSRKERRLWLRASSAWPITPHSQRSSSPRRLRAGWARVCACVGARVRVRERVQACLCGVVVVCRVDVSVVMPVQVCLLRGPGGCRLASQRRSSRHRTPPPPDMHLSCSSLCCAGPPSAASACFGGTASSGVRANRSGNCARSCGFGTICEQVLRVRARVCVCVCVCAHACGKIGARLAPRRGTAIVDSAWLSCMGRARRPTCSCARTHSSEHGPGAAHAPPPSATKHPFPSPHK
jgi:hypothetical protein